MTEEYWKRYKEKWLADPLNTDRMWQEIKKDMKAREKPKHHLELYSYCKSDNPYIRQIKNSPNINIETIAELICRDQACELQYCLSLQKVTAENRRSKLDLQGCKTQYDTMTSCLHKEKDRIKRKEMELRNKIYGIEMDQSQEETGTMAQPESQIEMKT